MQFVLQTQANAKTLQVKQSSEERNEWNHIFFLGNSLFICQPCPQRIFLL